MVSVADLSPEEMVNDPVPTDVESRSANVEDARDCDCARLNTLTL